MSEVCLSGSFVFPLTFLKDKLVPLKTWKERKRLAKRYIFACGCFAVVIIL
jgi:hypothetical protein